MIGTLSTQKCRVTTTHFRVCLDGYPHSQARRLGYHTFSPESKKTEPWYAPDVFSGASAPEKLPRHGTNSINELELRIQLKVVSHFRMFPSSHLVCIELAS